MISWLLKIQQKLLNNCDADHLDITRLYLISDIVSHTSEVCTISFLKKIPFFFFCKIELQRGDTRRVVFHLLGTPQMTAIARAEPICSQDPEVSSESYVWLYSITSPGHYLGSELKLEQPGYTSAPIWDPSITGGHLAYHAKVLDRVYTILTQHVLLIPSLEKHHESLIWNNNERLA